MRDWEYRGKTSNSTLIVMEGLVLYTKEWYFRFKLWKHHRSCSVEKLSTIENGERWRQWEDYTEENGDTVSLQETKKESSIELVFNWMKGYWKQTNQKTDQILV